MSTRATLFAGLCALAAALAGLAPRLFFASAPPAPAADARPCRIEVVEKGTGWPVPLVELRTTHGVRLVSDNAGLIALDLPEVMGRPTWFTVIGHGYEVPADGLGHRGVRLTPRRGKTLRVEVTRTIIAKRLGRLTGAGLFAESQKLGSARGWRESGITGCDTVQSAVWRGRRFWLWGDTLVPHYALGIYHTTAATTALRPIESFKPPLRLTFDYFADRKGAPRAVAKMAGKGPTWLTALVTLPDNKGVPRLVATYLKIKPPLEVYRCGLCAWNDRTNNFESVRIIWTKSTDKPRPPAVP